MGVKAPEVDFVAMHVRISQDVHPLQGQMWQIAFSFDAYDRADHTCTVISKEHSLTPTGYHNEASRLGREASFS